MLKSPLDFRAHVRDACTRTCVCLVTVFLTQPNKHNRRLRAGNIENEFVTCYTSNTLILTKKSVTEHTEANSMKNSRFHIFAQLCVAAIASPRRRTKREWRKIAFTWRSTHERKKVRFLNIPQFDSDNSSFLSPVFAIHGTVARKIGLAPNSCRSRFPSIIPQLKSEKKHSCVIIILTNNVRLYKVKCP